MTLGTILSFVVMFYTLPVDLRHPIYQWAPCFFILNTSLHGPPTENCLEIRSSPKSCSDLRRNLAQFLSYIDTSINNMMPLLVSSRSHLFPSKRACPYASLTARPHVRISSTLPLYRRLRRLDYGFLNQYIFGSIRNEQVALP